MRRDCRLKSNESYESVFSSCASSSLYTIVRIVFRHSKIFGPGLPQAFIRPNCTWIPEPKGHKLRDPCTIWSEKVLDCQVFNCSPVKSKVFDFKLVLVFKYSVGSGQLIPNLFGPGMILGWDHSKFDNLLSKWTVQLEEMIGLR